MPGDFMTQRSYQLAQKYDPGGKRTIGKSIRSIYWVELTAAAGYRCPNEAGQVSHWVWGPLVRFRAWKTKSNPEKRMVRSQTS